MESMSITEWFHTPTTMGMPSRVVTMSWPGPPGAHAAE